MRRLALVSCLAVVCLAASAGDARADAAQTIEGLGDALDATDLAFGLFDRTVGAAPIPAGPAATGSLICDTITVFAKTKEATERDGAGGGVFVFLRETSTTVVGNLAAYGGGLLAQGALATVVGGTLVPVAGGVLLGMCAKYLAQDIVGRGFDAVFASPTQADREAEKEWRKLRALDRWRLELFRAGQPPATRQDIARWWQDYGKERDFPEIADRPPTPTDDDRLAGVWLLDRQALLESAPVVARSVGADLAEVQAGLARLSLRLEFKDDGSFSFQGRTPSGDEVQAGGRWQLNARQISILHASGDPIPDLFFERNRVYAIDPQLGGMRMEFTRN